MKATFDSNYEKEIRRLIRKFGLTKEEVEGLINQSKEWFNAEQLFKNRGLRTVVIFITIISSLISIVWVCYKFMTEKK